LFKYLKYPATAIIAALSVVYLIPGICTFHPSILASCCSLFLSPEFADTPPAIAISLIPVATLLF